MYRHDLNNRYPFDPENGDWNNWNNWNNDSRNSQQNRNGGGSQFQRPTVPTNGMLAASIICGILGLISCYFILPGIFFGSLSVLFAVLSKGKSKKMPRRTRISWGIGLAGLLISLALATYSSVFIINRLGGIEQMAHKLHQYSVEYSNGEIDQNQLRSELIQEIYGESSGSSQTSGNSDEGSSDESNSDESSSSENSSGSSDRSSNNNNSGSSDHSYYGNTNAGEDV